MDDAITELRDQNSYLANIKWKTFDRNGNTKEHKGSYYICDGGYHNWQCLIPPFKHQVPGTDLSYWSHHIESMRKDVECVFGILKKRFLFLKHPIRFHNPQHIQNTFVTCCALHNILLDFDGYDDWEVRDIDWVPDVDHTNLEKRSKELAQKSSINCESYTRSERRRNNTDAVQEEDDDNGQENEHNGNENELFLERRLCLIDHYEYLKQSRELKLHIR